MNTEKNRGKRAQENVNKRLDKIDRALWEVFGEEEIIWEWEEERIIKEELRRLGYKEEEEEWVYDFI